MQSLHKFDYLIFIGRFQPFHNGHLYVARKALSLADKLIILCGSANEQNSAKNPWGFFHRKKMIKSCFNQEELSKIIIEPLNDIYPDDLWIEEISNIVNKHTKPEDKIGVIGCLKDKDSYWLNLFPFWELVLIDNYHNISATGIRAKFFAGEELSSDVLPETVIKLLK